MTKNPDKLCRLYCMAMAKRSQVEERAERPLLAVKPLAPGADPEPLDTRLWSEWARYDALAQKLAELHSRALVSRVHA